MSVVDIIMPKLGESIMEATVLKWHKKVGDAVKLDETLLDIATDKVDSEVPSTAEGILEEIVCNENDVVPIGSVIARIKTSQAVAQAVPLPEPALPVAPPAPPPAISVDSSANGNAGDVPFQPSSFESAPKGENGRFYSPLVMNIASREGISLSELEKISGSGNEGRVTKKDILHYLENRQSAPIVPSVQHTPFVAPPSHTSPIASVPVSPATESPSVHSVDHPTNGNVEIIEMDRMRRLISEHMTRSKATSAHVTSFSEADVTNIFVWRDSIKKDFEKREGEKITLTPIFIEAIVKCLRKFPLLNSSIQGDKIIVKKDINIGMATALPTGNLIVPVIKGADHFNLIGLTKQVNRLALQSRTGKLHPTDTQDGTFTFTNVGTFGSLMGTPIINQPQVAILATGTIKKKPIVVESDKGDSIAIRHMMFVSMSYDHRIIDGAMGASFLTEFVKTLESFGKDRTL